MTTTMNTSHWGDRLGQSIQSLKFLVEEPKDSSLCSKNPSTGPYPHLFESIHTDQSNLLLGAVIYA